MAVVDLRPWRARRYRKHGDGGLSRGWTNEAIELPELSWSSYELSSTLCFGLFFYAYHAIFFIIDSTIGIQLYSMGKFDEGHKTPCLDRRRATPAIWLGRHAVCA